MECWNDGISVLKREKFFFNNWPYPLDPSFPYSILVYINSFVSLKVSFTRLNGHLKMNR